MVEQSPDAKVVHRAFLTIPARINEYLSNPYCKWTIGIMFVGLFIYVLVSDSGEAIPQSDVKAIPLSSEINSLQIDGIPEMVAYGRETDPIQKAAPASGVQTKGSGKIAGPRLVRRMLNLSVPDGAMAEANLVTGARSGPVKAVLSTELRSRFGELLLPRDTTLIGSAQASGDRLQIRFVKAILPDGDVVKVSADALDGGDKTPGIKGSFVARQGMVLAGSIALNALSGVADGLQENEAVGVGIAKKANTRNALLNGASRASLDQAKELTQDFRESSKSISVASGTKIIVLFGEESQGGG